MAVTDRQREYLDAMGIQTWSLRQREEGGDVVTKPESKAAAAIPVELDLYAPVSTELTVDDVWQRLEYQVAQCTACDLHKQRTQTVFGVGNHQADWMIVGEAPGADEDRQGQPFVGRAGKLLDAMLLAVGLQRDQVFIANILKCRPPNNRDPHADEVQHCLGYLQRQIALVNPRVILAVGAVAAQTLLDTHAPVGRLRGQQHHYGESEIPLVVTYHPAYLLRTPSEKRRAWQDLQLARQVATASAA